MLIVQCLSCAHSEWVSVRVCVYFCAIYLIDDYRFDQRQREAKIKDDAIYRRPQTVARIRCGLNMLQKSYKMRNWCAVTLPNWQVTSYFLSIYHIQTLCSDKWCVHWAFRIASNLYVNNCMLGRRRCRRKGIHWMYVVIHVDWSGKLSQGIRHTMEMLTREARIDQTSGIAHCCVSNSIFPVNIIIKSK